MPRTKYKDLDETIEEMRVVADRLVFHTWPQVPMRQEAEIDTLKQRQIVVDGYDLLLHFNRADYNACRVESLEICGLYTPFLPMYLVCKVAAKFLGGHELKYAEAFKNGRKVYLWTVAVDERGCPIPLDHSRLRRGEYQGFRYSYVSTELL